MKICYGRVLGSHVNVYPSLRAEDPPLPESTKQTALFIERQSATIDGRRRRRLVTLRELT